MDKINIELQQSNDGDISVVMQTDVDRSSFMYFFACVLKKSLPEIIKCTKTGYEEYKKEVNKKQTTH